MGSAMVRVHPLLPPTPTLKLLVSRALLVSMAFLGPKLPKKASLGLDELIWML